MALPARQVPDQPAVDGPKRQLAPLRARPSPLARCPESTPPWSPRNRGPAPARSSTTPSPQPHSPPSRALAQQSAGPATQSPVNRLARRPFPNHHRLALIRNADRRHIPRTRPDLAQHLHRARKLAGQNLRRVVLHPPRLRVKLLKLVLRRGGNRPRLVKENCAGTRRSLVQRKYVSHSRPSPFGNQSNTPGGF